MTTVLVGPRGLHRLVPAEAVRRGRPRLVREDVRQRLDQVLDRLTATPGQLRPQDVEPTLQHAAQVGKVGLLLLGLAAHHPHLLEWQARQPLEVVLREHPVDPPVSSLRHACAPLWIGIGRRFFTPSIARASSGDNGGPRAGRAKPAARVTSCSLSCTGSPGANVKVSSMPTRRCPPVDSAAIITGIVVRPTPVAENVAPAGSAATHVTSACVVPGIPPGTPITRSQCTCPP